MVRQDSIFDHAERALLARQMIAERALEYLADHRPAMLFDPHDNGQIQALCSDHKYRILIPGNGWGKTTCMAVDNDCLMQRDDPFKPHMMPKPDRPTTSIWYCQKYQQWEMMAPDVEEVFTRGWKWHSQKHYYEWPNGSRTFILSSDSDWTAIQGVQIDAVYFDEHPDRKFWNEMMYRRRGKKKTRYMVAATMTQGMTWFVTQLIQKVEKSYTEQGLTAARALELQPHPEYFLWNVGGVESNPATTDEDREHYESIETASEKERHVRLKGGYADFTGEPVFNLEALERMTAAPGTNGAIVFRGDDDPSVQSKLILDSGGQPMGHRFSGLLDHRYFDWRPEMEVPGGRITIYEMPDPDQAGNYVMGSDFAAGLVGKDYDAACVGLKTSEGRVVQVAEAVGHWGDIFFAEVLYSLGVLYYMAFLVGERQFGLPCMRRLYDEMGYTYQYFQRRDDTQARRHSDKLGHHRGSGDMIIQNHQLAIRRGDVLFRSADSIRQHKRYQFQPKKKDDVIDDVERSSDLTTGAPSGENDDLVMACAYMMHGAREIIHYPRPQIEYKPGSFGDVMGLADTLRGRKKPKDPYAKG